MRINIVVYASDRVRQKIKYGFTLLFQPLRAEIIFSNEIQTDSINIFYGNDQPSDMNNPFSFEPSADFEDCIRDSTLPDISNLDWYDFKGKKLPKLFPVSDGSFDFDIAAATFILASEFQDLISLERDEFDRLRAMDSLQDRLGILDFPVVNYYSMLLKEKLEEFFNIDIKVKQYGDSDYGLALTHDVDYTSSLNLRMIKRNIFGHALLNNESLTPNERAMKLLYPLFAIGGYDPPKSGLRFLKSIEMQKGLKSTFFIKTGSTAKQDMNYNYRSRSFRNYVDSLIGAGFEIGIHPSMKTYIDGKQLFSEKKRLEDVVGKEISSVRQHYLKFTASKTVGAWEGAGLKYDSTLGFSRKAGFRNSVAFPFALYNFKEDRNSTVTELPLLFMDGTFADNRSLTVNETFKRMNDLIAETKAAQGAASILFHNSLTDSIDFPGYKKIYEQILTASASNDCKMDSLSGIIQSFR